MRKVNWPDHNFPIASVEINSEGLSACAEMPIGSATLSCRVSGTEINLEPWAETPWFRPRKPLVRLMRLPGLESDNWAPLPKVITKHWPTYRDLGNQ